jgi:hypothetical protein
MFSLFTRTLAQGVQAFTPIAAALVAFSGAAQRRPRAAIHRGLLLAAPTTLLAAWWFSHSDARAFDQALLSTLTVAAVIGAIVAGKRAPAALAVGTTVVVVRQTAEITSVFAVAAFRLRSFDATSAIATAVVLAALHAWVVIRIGRALPRSVAFALVRMLTAIFVIQAAVYALHEWSEARVLPWSDALHAATEPYGPEGVYGMHVTDLLIVGPVAALLWPTLWARFETAAALARTAIGVQRPATATLVAICVVSMGMQRTDARPPSPHSAVTPGEIAAALARPHILFRNTAPGATFGQLSIAPIDDLHVRLPAGVTCERVAFGGGRGLCLHVDRGVFNRYSALLLDARLTPGASMKLQGLPSRTRVAADGQVGATTVFVTGDGYASDFSTRTVVVDAASGDEIGELEQFTTWRDGVRFRAADFNFWGVTFARDGSTFYASLRTAGTTYLVRGELARRRMTVLRPQVECPSLSPDGRLLAYKKRVGPSPDSWRLHVLDLTTNLERIIETETRYVDDQVEWLDSNHVLYAIPRRTTAIADVWVAAIGGGEPARIFLAEAESPIVVR